MLGGTELTLGSCYGRPAVGPAHAAPAAGCSRRRLVLEPVAPELPDAAPPPVPQHRRRTKQEKAHVPEHLKHRTSTLRQCQAECSHHVITTSDIRSSRFEQRDGRIRMKFELLTTDTMSCSTVHCLTCEPSLW